MLYLVQPDGSMSLCDVPETLSRNAAAQHDLDLGGLPWEPASRRADADVVGLALRRGAKCSTGLVVGGTDLYPLDRPALLERTHRDMEASHAKIRPNPLLEQMDPGSSERSRENDARIAAQHQVFMDQARADVAKLLAPEPDPVLIEHWVSLGGAVPSSGR